MSEQAPEPAAESTESASTGTEWTAPPPEGTDPNVDEEGNLTEAGVRAAQAGLPGWHGGEDVEGVTQPFDSGNQPVESGP